MPIGRPLLLALVALAPAGAGAFSISLLDGDSGNIVRWHTPNLTYYLHQSGSADVVDGSDLDAVRAGWQQWNDVPCSALDFVEAGLTTNKATMAVGGPPNGKNEVTWAEGSEWIHGQFVLGITNTSFSVPSGEIGEADITFNGFQNKWSTNGKAGTVDVLNVAVHEQGHFFGAQHVLGGYSPSNPPTMAPSADPGLKTQTLEADDQACACFLYPQTEYTCQSDADCPYVVDTNQLGEEYYVGKVTCQSGLCGGISSQIPEGDKTLGESCASDVDCVDPLFCQPTGAGSAVCAKPCSGDGDCGSGFACYPYSNASGGVCLPYSGGGGGGGPTKGTGEPCNSAQECLSGLCVGQIGTSDAYCRQACTLGGGQCGASEECAQLQGSSLGACLPTQGGVAIKPPGEACASPTECISGLCVGGGGSGYFCRESCSPALGDCPEEHTCFQLVGGGGACVPTGPGSGLGEPCEFSSDCDSDLCLGIRGQPDSYCSTDCPTGSECPCGMECTEFGGGDELCTVGGSQACVPSGNPCEGAEVCISQTCISGICRDPCQLGAAACPPGQSCKRLKAGSANGVCAAQGAAEVGATCSADADCQSNLCSDGACQLPCEPGVTFCGDGRSCQTVGDSATPLCADAPDEGTDGTDATDGATDGTDETDPTDGADGFTGASDGTDGTDGAGGGGGGGGTSGGCQAAGAPGALGWSALMLLGLLALRRPVCGIEDGPPETPRTNRSA